MSCHIAVPDVKCCIVSFPQKVCETNINGQQQEISKKKKNKNPFGPLYIERLFTLHPECNSIRSYNRNAEVFLPCQEVGLVLPTPTYYPGRTHPTKVEPHTSPK